MGDGRAGSKMLISSQFHEVRFIARAAF